MAVIGAEHKYARAIVKYSQALELAPTNVKLLANRAFAHLRLENYGSAVEDSSKAIELDATFFKVFFNFFPTSSVYACRYPILTHSIPSRLPFQAYYRRGSSHFALGKFSEALRDFRKVRCCHIQFMTTLHVLVNTRFKPRGSCP